MCPVSCWEHGGPYLSRLWCHPGSINIFLVTTWLNLFLQVVTWEHNLPRLVETLVTY